ncbi:MAG: TetR/AcrR family transcriptional regulator [Clostridiaceae bacterium]|jgi:AcrR family transcriptional regulator|nr:TetR/AcrR family transcriptional regulator [Clostridiaceae bacterium]
MSEPKLSRKIRYTRMVLKDSLLELMKQKPISKITVKELCENADINRSTYYSHYSDPYDLLKKIENETLEWAEKMVTTLLEQTDENETIKILESILEYITDNSKHIQVLMSEQGDIDFQKQLLSMLYNRCGISPANEKNADSLTNEYYFIFVVNGSVGLIQYWLKSGLNKSAREMAEIIFNMAYKTR